MGFPGNRDRRLIIRKIYEESRMKIIQNLYPGDEYQGLEIFLNLEIPIRGISGF